MTPELQAYIRSTRGIKPEKIVARELGLSVWQVKRYRKTNPAPPVRYMVCTICGCRMEATKTLGIERVRKCENGHSVKTTEVVCHE